MPPETSAAPANGADEPDLPPAYDAPRVIAFAAIAGGSTKTTNCVNVAAMAADCGYRVAVVDIDQQANATEILGHYDYTGDTVYDVMGGQVRMADAAIPARYTVGDDPKSKNPGDFQAIPRLWIVPGDERMRNADTDLAARQAEGYTVDWMRNEIPDLVSRLRLDTVFIDFPASAGLLVVSALAAATEVAACMRSEFKELKGVSGIEDALAKVRANRRWDSGQQIKAVIAGDVPAKNAGRVYQDALDTAREMFGAHVVPTVRHSVRVPETYVWAVPLMYWAPKHPVTKDYWAVTEAMGFTPRSGIERARFDEARFAARQARDEGA